MLSKITLLVLVVVFGAKLLLRPQFKGLLKRFDHFVNLLLIAIAIAYGVQLLWLVL